MNIKKESLIMDSTDNKNEKRKEEFKQKSIEPEIQRYKKIESVSNSILEENKEAFKKLSQWITSHLIICYNIHDGGRLGLQTRESI